MYDCAEHVLALHAAGLRAALIRAVTTVGTSAKWPGQVLAVTSDGGVHGSFLNGATDGTLVALGRSLLDEGRSGALVDVALDEAAAARAGLVCAGAVTVLVHPSTDVPDEAWQRLAVGEPVCLVTDVSRHNVGRTSWFTLDSLALATQLVAQAVPGTRHGPAVVAVFGRGATCQQVVRLPGPLGADALVAAHWPAPRLLVVGSGLLADALLTLAQTLAWDAVALGDPRTAVGAAAAARPGDAVVLLSHDLAVDGPLLLAALRSGAGYVGAVGSAATHAARVAWLRSFGADDPALAALHGPAGLDIGARTPREIALSIVAEVLATRSRASGRRLREVATGTLDPA